jgi:hypothetical protein
MVKRNYHRTLFELIGINPPISSPSQQRMNAWEREHGRKIPHAVRQWYEREAPEREVTAGLFHPSDGAYYPEVFTFRLVSLSELLRGYASSGKKVLFAAGQYDPLFCYRSSEWKLYLVKDTGSDPLVINQDDEPELTLGRGLERPGRFSDFLLYHFWHNNRPGGVKLSVAGGTINPACLDYLKEHYGEAWGWVSEEQFCFAFFNRSARIGVDGWKCGDPTREVVQAVCWDFEAGAEGELQAVLAGLWPLATIPFTRSEVTIYDHPPGLLRRLARRLPPAGGV